MNTTNLLKKQQFIKSLLINGYLKTPLTNKKYKDHIRKRSYNGNFHRSKYKD